MKSISEFFPQRLVVVVASIATGAEISLRVAKIVRVVIIVVVVVGSVIIVISVSVSIICYAAAAIQKLHISVNANV